MLRPSSVICHHSPPPAPSMHVRLGRTFVTPPPPQPQSYVQLTDAQRRRPSPAPLAAAATPARPTALPPSPASSPTKRTHFDSQQTAQEVIESFEDVEFPAVEEDDDEIHNDDDVHPVRAPTTPSLSPSKKARFDSFTGPVSPRTPSKRGGNSFAGSQQPATSLSVSSPSSAFAAIRDDPDSPFHAIQRSLFAGDSSSTPSSAAATALPDTTASGVHARAGEADAFSHLASALAPVGMLLQAAQKERDKDARLLVAAKRKEETLRRSYEKERDEKDRLRRENEALKNRVKCV